MPTCSEASSTTGTTSAASRSSRTAAARCRRASVLLAVENITPPRMTPSAGLQRMALLDLHMLLGPDGRKRSEAEYQALLVAAGLAWTRTLPLSGDIGPSLIEGRPA
jgi:hypothetical protein